MSFSVTFDRIFREIGLRPKKPHLRICFPRHMKRSAWICEAPGTVSGYGVNPDMAYGCWRANNALPEPKNFPPMPCA